MITGDLELPKVGDTQPGMFDWSPREGRLHWDDRMYEIFELDRVERKDLFQHLTQVLHPADRTRLLGLIEQSLHPAGRTPYFASEARIHLGEREKLLEITFRFLRDEQGVYSVLGTCRDIGSLREKEQELQRNLLYMSRMARVDRILRRSSELKDTLERVLEATLEFFDSDRALLHAPGRKSDSTSWLDPVIRFREGCEPRALLGNTDTMPASARRVMASLFERDTPLALNGHSTPPLDGTIAELYGIRSALAVAVKPRNGPPWILSLHCCTTERDWSEEDSQTLQGIGSRLADTLDSYRMQIELQASTNLWRSLAEHSPDHVVHLDVDGVIRFSNRRIRRLQPEQLVGQNLGELLNDEGAKGLHCCLARVRADGEVHSYEFADKTLPGGTRLYEVRIAPLEGKEGLTGFILNSQDISERKRAQQALNDSEARFRALVENSVEAIVLLDADTGCFVDVNSQAEKLYGIPREELLKIGPGDVSPEFQPDGQPSMIKASAKIATAASGKAPSFLWTHMNLDTGESIPCEVHLVRLPHSSRTLLRGSVYDISSRLQMEEERLQLERQVQHAQKLESLGVMAGGIAHDFNNLLMSIMGNADLARGRVAEDSEVAGHLNEIERASRRAADLARQMLAYSGKGRFVTEAINANELIREMAELLGVSVSKKATLELDLAEDLPAFEGDVTQIRQVVMNLITNASEAIGDAEGRIRLRTGLKHCDRSFLRKVAENFGQGAGVELVEGTYLFFEISDTGEGMDAKTIERIFDPFFTTKFTGRGLGLSAVLGIIRGHRGLVKLKSAPGRGTTFRVYLPVLENASAAADPAPAVTQNSDSANGGLVLFADDETMVREVGTHMLRRLGYEVLPACDGKEAFDLYLEHRDRVRLVLLDLTMPRLSGDEVFRKIRENDSKVPILLCSGYTEHDSSRRFADMGLDGFLEKPFSLSGLKLALEEALSSSLD